MSAAVQHKHAVINVTKNARYQLIPVLIDITFGHNLILVQSVLKLGYISYVYLIIGLLTIA